VSPEFFEFRLLTRNPWLLVMGLVRVLGLEPVRVGGEFDT
jgi:hypothetical protein